MGRIQSFFFYVLILASAELFAAPGITIIPPVLVDDMTSLQTSLNQAVTDFSTEIQPLAEEAFEKPLFMQGFSAAAGYAALVPTVVFEDSRFFLMIGSTAAVYSEALDLSMIERLAALNPESDEKTGLSTQPVMLSGGLSLESLFPGLSAGADLGYSDIESGDYAVRTFSIGLNLGYQLLRGNPGLLRWNGLNLGCGGNFSFADLSVTVRPGLLTEDVELDPDGAGPLVPFSTTLGLDPTVRISVQSAVWRFHLRAASALTFVETFSLIGGAGLALSSGSSVVGISADEEILIDGYVGDLVVVPGRVLLDGVTESNPAVSLRGYAHCGLRFAVGSLTCTVPVIWQPANGFAVGVFAGVRL